ncbi:MAG: ABC transporter permease [Rhodothermaceae bacterium]|nr:ABC transporter permease [Rhodothermaceae bacterium]
MKSFFGFIIKEFRHIIRDRRTLVILFGLPVIQLVLFGYALRNELTEAGIAVLDMSNDHVTLDITEKVLSSGHFQLNARLTHSDQIEPAFRRGHVRMVLLFEPGFAENLTRDGSASAQIITDASDPNMAQLLQGYVMAILQDYERSLQLPGGVAVQAGSPVEISAPTAQTGASALQTGRVMPEVRMMFNPELRSANMFVPGLIAFILMLISALMTSITITREKETGTMEVLLASPLHPVQIILGKVAPYLLLSVVNVLTVLVLALLLFDVPFRGSFMLFMALSGLFIVTALSLGILISTITSSQQVAMMIALAGLLLPVIILSGFIFPISNMPEVLQYFSHIVPAKWYLIIVKGIMLKGVGMAYIWKETLILTGMTLFLLLLSIKNFKIRLQ